VTVTEMLKFVSDPWSFLAWMKRRMSGCLHDMMPMLAPRRTPPCLTVSVIVLTMSMKETGPEAMPRPPPTDAPAGRSSS
jgi:hypothetical protein